MYMKQGFEMGESPINSLQDEGGVLEAEKTYDPDAKENIRAYVLLEVDVIKASLGAEKFTTENKAIWIENHSEAFRFVIRENSHLLRDYAEGMTQKDKAKMAIAVEEVMKLLG